MTAFLDELAKSLARPMSRSRALRLAGGAIVAASVPSLALPRRAWSRAADCNAKGGGCIRTARCCYTSDGFAGSCCPWYFRCAPTGSGLCREQCICEDGRGFCGPARSKICCGKTEDLFPRRLPHPLPARSGDLQGAVLPQGLRVRSRSRGRAARSSRRAPRSAQAVGPAAGSPAASRTGAARIPRAACAHVAGRSRRSAAGDAATSARSTAATRISASVVRTTPPPVRPAIRAAARGRAALGRTSAPASCHRRSAASRPRPGTSVARPSARCPARLSSAARPARCRSAAGCSSAPASRGSAATVRRSAARGTNKTCCQRFSENIGTDLNQTCCNGRCVTLNYDPANCGSCGQRCAANQRCLRGRCVAA